MRPFLGWLIARARGADIVSVGVNLVVGTLLVGGVLGSAFMHGKGTAAPVAPVGAAVAGLPQDATGNHTNSSPSVAPSAAVMHHHHDDH